MPLNDQFETLFRSELTTDEQLLLRSFRRLPQSKRQALLALIG